MDIPSYLLGRIKGSGGAGVSYIVVEELPTTGEEGTIYLVPKEDSQTDNVYNEYMYINDEWEKIGDTEIDLSDYQHLFQYAIVPNATADNVGKIIQYTGTTTQDYTNGYFYQCVSDGQDTATYSWENINTQASDEPRYIKDANGVKIFLINYNWQKSKMFAPLTEFVKEYQKNSRTSFIIYGSGNNNNDGIFEYDSSGSGYISFKNINDYITKITTDNNGNVIYNKLATLRISFNTTTYEVISITWGTLEEDKTNFLGLTNTTAFTPTGDYNPATKKYVDDSIASAIGTALGGSY